MRYLLVVVFVGISIISFAEKTVGRAIYEAEVDKLNCELAKFYMEKNQGLETLSNYEDYLAITGCNFEHLIVFIKQRQPEMHENGEFAYYIENFKNEYENSVNNNVLYNKLIGIFQNPILDKYSNEDNFISLKNLFKARLKEKLRVEEIGNTVNQEVAETKTLMERLRDFGMKEAFLVAITIGIIFIFVSLISWFYKYTKTGNLSITNPPQKPQTQQQKAIVNTNIAANAKTINDLHAQPKIPVNPPVQNKVIQVNTSIVPPAPIINSPIDKEVVEVIEDAEEEELPNEDVFYMPYPSVDGSFYEYGKHDVYEEGKSTFRFEIKLKEYNLATFEVISNQDVMTDALMNFEKTLNAVCVVIGRGTEHDKNHEIIIKPGLKRIVTIEPGTVQLKTQHWRLKQKAKIKLEY